MKIYRSGILDQIFVKFSSPVDGRLCINNSYFYEITKHKKIKLKITFNQSFFVEFTPINSLSQGTYLCKMIYKNQELHSQAKDIIIFRYDDANFGVHIDLKCENNQDTETSARYWCEYNEKNKKIFYKNQILEYSDRSKYKTYELHKFAEPKIQMHKNTIILSGFVNDKKAICLICIENNKIIYNFCRKYEIKENNVLCVEKLNTYAKHNKVNIYDCENLELIEKYVAYEAKPKQITNKNIIPYAFAQNLYAEDFNLAKSMLDEHSFTDTANKNAIMNFFGNFSIIATPQISTPKYTICLLYKKSTNYYDSRYFTFEFDSQSNKISNIYEHKN